MMSTSQAAIAAIGGGQSRDWQLHPETHAAALPPAAGALSRVLLEPNLRVIMQAFNQADTAAGAAQKRYKRLAKTSAITSFLAVAIASLLLLPRAAIMPPGLLTAASFTQFGLLAVSFIASIWIGVAKPYDIWMRERAKAETKRIELFDTVVAASESPRVAELPLLPLQLEYVRRYQLDVQRAYYAGRGRQHRWAALQGSIWRVASLAIIGAALAPVVASARNADWLPAGLATWFALLPPPIELSQRLFLSLGLIGGALQGLLAAYALLGQHERNAARYLDTSRNLEDLAGRPLEEARAAAAEGRQGPVLAFVALLHQQISSEHREWMALRAIAPDLSLDKLKTMSLPRL